MEKKLLIIVLWGIFIVTLLMGCTKKEGEMIDKISPIIDQEGADPSIIKKDGMYYYTKTTGNNVVLSKAESFLDVASGEKRVIYEPDNELKDIWAPEIQYIDGSWYIYFAAVRAGEEMHHMYVLHNDKKDPFEGSWHCSALKGMDDKFAIDGVVLQRDSQKYFIWSGWEGYENIQQNLYLAEMVSPTEVKREKILLSVPEYEWEKYGEPLVNEGPEILIKNDTINLMYSASGSWTDQYCLGLLTADIKDDLKNPESWKKEPLPILSSANGVYGPGHNGFTVSGDNTQDILLYHAARWQGAGWSRSIRFGYLEFDSEGKIKEMQPASSETLIQLPAGENKREVYTADSFEMAGEVVVEKEGDGDYGKSVVGFLNHSDSISVKIHQEKKKESIIYIFLKNSEVYDDSFITEMEISVNDKKYCLEAYPSAYYQPLAFRVILEKGDNLIRINSLASASSLAVNRIEVGS